MHTCLFSKPSLLNSGSSYGGRRPVVTARTGLEPAANTKTKPEPAMKPEPFYIFSESTVQRAGQAVSDEILASFKVWLRERNRFVFLYWVPVNNQRQDRFGIKVPKKRLRDCSKGVEELHTCIAKELHKESMGPDNQNVRLWWSDKTPDFDDLDKTMRYFVFADKDVSSSVDEAVAWLLEETPA